MGVVNVKRWEELREPSVSLLMFLLSQEGYQVTKWRDNAGTFCGMHTHPDEQVHWVITGELEVTVLNEDWKPYKYVLKAGDRDLIKANVSHSTRVLGNSDLHYLIGSKHIKPKKTRKKKVDEGSEQEDKTVTKSKSAGSKKKK